MTVKLRVIILTITFLCLTSIVSAVPLLPTEFYGTVYINGSPAPAGTTITSIIGNQAVGSYVTSIPGVFGGPGFYDTRLVVYGTDDGQVISFEINGIPATQTAVFHPGVPGEIMLSVGPSPSVSPTVGTTVAPTQQPVIDTVNEVYGGSAQMGASTGASAQVDSRAGASAPVLMTLTQPATPPVQVTPVSASNPAVQPASSVERSATQIAGAGATTQTSDPTSSIPGYAVAGFIVIAVVFVGYGIVRSWLR
jgi:hypothetical protein